MSSPSAAQPDVPAGQLAFLVAQVGGLAAQRFAERIEPLGLSPAQAGLLRVVAAHPGRSQQAIASLLGLVPSRLVVLVDGLESAGLLERRRDPADRRYHALHLTTEGTNSLRRIGRAAMAHGNDLLAPLDTAERNTLATLLRKLATHHGLTPDVHPGYRALGGEGRTGKEQTRARRD